jgi:glucokinase-like ROK family protein
MAYFQAGGSFQMREMNLSSVLWHLHHEGPLSRAQLAKQTRLHKATISSLVEELIALGLVHEVGMQPSEIGRPSILLKLNPEAGTIIGVEIGVGFLSVILSNFTGEIVWKRYEETSTAAGQTEILACAYRLVEEVCQSARQGAGRLLGMGLALPGMVDIEKGVLVFSPNLQWRDVPLQKMFAEQTGLPVYVDNDANAAALGEHLFGVARQKGHFLFIVAGVGVGGGLFLNGDLYRGATGLAGEIGHTNLNGDQTRHCRCGKRGCWENYANQSSLYERIRARLEVGRQSLITSYIDNQSTQLTLPLITRAAESGDAEVLEALHETGAALGLGVANLINTFNPEMVVIGGALSLAGKFMLPSIQKVIEEHSLDVIRKPVEILISSFGSDASVMGASAMVVQGILSNPTAVRRAEKTP